MELIWQKANSINGIRKMNMSFKEERRRVFSTLDANDKITDDYWYICESFIQMMEVKQSANLRILTANSENETTIQ